MRLALFRCLWIIIAYLVLVTFGIILLSSSRTLLHSANKAEVSIMSNETYIKPSLVVNDNSAKPKHDDSAKINLAESRFSINLSQEMLDLVTRNQSGQISQLDIVYKKLEEAGIKNITGHPSVKILHRTWKNSTVPQRWKTGFRSCRIRKGSFTQILWTDEDIERFIKREYGWFWEVFQSYPFDIQRVDAAKYFLIYHYGGVYLDMDISCKKWVDQMLEYIKSGLPGFNVALAPADPFGVTADFLISTPKHPFMSHVIHELSKCANHYYVFPFLTVFMTTGPMFLTRCLWSYHNATKDVMIIPQSAYTGGKFISHLVGGSWHRWDGKLSWYLYNDVGFVKICAIIMLLVLLCCFMKHAKHSLLLVRHTINVVFKRNRK